MILRINLLELELRLNSLQPVHNFSHKIFWLRHGWQLVSFFLYVCHTLSPWEPSLLERPLSFDWPCRVASARPREIGHNLRARWSTRAPLAGEVDLVVLVLNSRLCPPAPQGSFHLSFHTRVFEKGKTRVVNKNPTNRLFGNQRNFNISGQL